MLKIWVYWNQFEQQSKHVLKSDVKSTTHDENSCIPCICRLCSKRWQHRTHYCTGHLRAKSYSYFYFVKFLRWISRYFTSFLKLATCIWILQSSGAKSLLVIWLVVDLCNCNFSLEVHLMKGKHIDNERAVVFFDYDSKAPINLRTSSGNRLCFLLLKYKLK